MNIPAKSNNKMKPSRLPQVDPDPVRIQAEQENDQSTEDRPSEREESVGNGGANKGKESRAEASRRRRGDSNEAQWVKCRNCGKLIYKQHMEEMLFVCPECNFHFEIPGPVRINTLIDQGTFTEKFSNITPQDPLNFSAKKAYKDRLVAAQKNTGLQDACIVGEGEMDQIPVVFGVSDSRFLRGSMGSVVGEKNL